MIPSIYEYQCIPNERFERFTKDYSYVSWLSLTTWFEDFIDEMGVGSFDDQSWSELEKHDSPDDEKVKNEYFPVPAALAGHSQFQELLMQSWSSVLDDENALHAFKESYEKSIQQTAKKAAQTGNATTVTQGGGNVFIQQQQEQI